MATYPVEIAGLKKRKQHPMNWILNDGANATSPVAILDHFCQIMMISSVQHNIPHKLNQHQMNWMSCDGVSLKGYLHRLSEFQCGDYAFEHSTLAYALLFRAFGAFCLCCDVDWRRHNIIFLPILSTRLSFAFESILSAKIYMASKYLKEVHTIKPTNVITCNV